MRKLYALPVAVLLASPAGLASSVMDIERACIERANLHGGVHWLEECVQEMFTADPFHVTLTSVAPGAGLAAFGPAFAWEIPYLSFDTIFSALAAVSTDGSTVGQAQITFALPGRGFRLDRFRRTNTDRYGLQTLARAHEANPIDAKASVTLRLRRTNAREQDFYGLGPGTGLTGLATYGLQLTEATAGIDNPLTSWSSAGFDFSLLTPRITNSINTAAPAIQMAYNAASAPGLFARDNFLRYEPYLTFRVPPHKSYFTSVRAGYRAYQALGDARYSFRQAAASSTTGIPLWIPSHNTPYHRTWYANAVCPSLRSATRCSLGTLTFNTFVTVSYTNRNTQVPFFFDQTLGGTDLSGADTLRGFVDYRFRGPSSVLFQAEYRHPLWGPIGLLVFYDTGKVALRPSDISFGQFRHDAGIGAYLHAANHELARLYIGFGSGEGSRLSPKFPGSF